MVSEMAGPFKYDIKDIAHGTLGMYRAKDAFTIRHPFTADHVKVNKWDQFVLVGIDDEEDPILLTFCHVQSRYKVCLTIEEFKSDLEPLFRS